MTKTGKDKGNIHQLDGSIDALDTAIVRILVVFDTVNEGPSGVFDF